MSGWRVCGDVSRWRCGKWRCGWVDQRCVLMEVHVVSTFTVIIGISCEHCAL